MVICLWALAGREAGTRQSPPPAATSGALPSPVLSPTLGGPEDRTSPPALCLRPGAPSRTGPGLKGGPRMGIKREAGTVFACPVSSPLSWERDPQNPLKEELRLEPCLPSACFHGPANPGGVLRHPRSCSSLFGAAVSPGVSQPGVALTSLAGLVALNEGEGQGGPGRLLPLLVLQEGH